MEGRLASAMQEVEERSKVMVVRQQELISKQMLEALDKDSRAELSDNAWLNKEVWTTEGVVHEHSQCSLIPRLFPTPVLAVCKCK